MSYIFVSFQQITFKLGNFTNLKALFSVVSTDFPFFPRQKFRKNREKVYPKQSYILDSTPWILDSRYWIPVFVSGTWILDSNL